MKKITAYVNTLRVHWLVEGLEQLGVNDIMVTEFFKPTSKISRLELCCQDELVEKVRKTVHRLGTTGNLPDHDFLVNEFDPTLPGQIPIGERMSRLEESRVKQLINVLLKGLTAKISTAFLVIAMSILAMGVFAYQKIGTFQDLLDKTSKNTRIINEAASQIQQSLLLEMLAAERMHRGDHVQAEKDFEMARSDLQEAIGVLNVVNRESSPTLDSIVVLERRFQSVVGTMFALIGQLSSPPARGASVSPASPDRTHQDIMNGLEQDRLHFLGVLRSFEKKMSEHDVALAKDVEGAVTDVRISLTILVAIAGIITLVTWLVAEREVSGPLQVLVEESRTIDSGELR